MNKIDYNTKPTEKGIDNFIWVHETKIKQAENEIEELKQLTTINSIKSVITTIV